jgi:M6 family metalloprotease-like protein
MKKVVLCITFTLVLVLMCRSVFAMPANPAAFEVRQPDGSAIQIHIRGDERFNWYEDLDGYTVVRENGRYAYAQLDKNKRLMPTSLTVGVDNPKAAGLQKKTLPPVEVRRSLRPSLLSGSSESSAAPAAVPPLGTVKNLVILCKFSNHTLGAHTRAAGDYDILFNRVGGHPTLAPTGSVKDLYLENSYGAMTLQSTVVTTWVTLPHTEAYYANGEDGTGDYPKNAQGMVEDALNLVDPLVDFSQFDNDHDGYIDAINIVHSGYDASSGGGGGNWIWSHRWSLFPLPGGEWTSHEGVKVYSYLTVPALWGTSGTSIARFGVIAHEMGHFFGLPDLYDTDGSGGEGLGYWCEIANSWGFDQTQLHPPHFSAWSKIKLGWVTPTVLSTPGLYTIGQAETNPQVYRINYGYPSSEYLLIENRQPVGIETAMPQGGLCIYHIDDLAGYNTEGYPGQAGWPENGNHYGVAILQADGNYDLEKGNNRGDSGDVFHASGVSEISSGPGNHPNTDAYQGGNIIVTNNTLHSISAAGASMSFVYNNLTVSQPPVAQAGSASTQINTSIPITLVATDDGLPNPPGALTYIITSLPSNGVLINPPYGVISSVPYTLPGYGDQVVYTPDTSFTGSDSFQFKANDGGTAPSGGDSNPATVTVNISTEQLIYTATMDTNPGWTLDSLWQWGTPTGSGGQHGKPDPTAGYTGANVVGYNLLGDYENLIASTQWAKTPAINCTSRTGVTLTFYRWLNVEQPLYDHAYIQVSNNGSSWSTIWENTSETITDSSWTLRTFDISAIADDQPTVYIRWGMGPTDSSWQYSGWNIDDVKITGASSLLPQPPVAQAGSASTQINTSIPITLVATDDGLPNPPGALTYIITSLPSNGVLSDPGNGVISSVPYSLFGYGDQVVYTPDTSFAGSDSFQFKANDGGTAPNGGDSNPATVSVTVINSTVIFSEDFESGLGGFVIDNSFGNGNGLWHLSTVCNAALPGHTKPTALFYGLDGSCTYDNGLTNQGVVISPSISLAGFPTSPIELRLKYFLKTEGSPADYDRVSIEISENGGPFILISHNNTTPEPVTLTDPSITWLETVVDLSAFAGSSIQLCFSFSSVDAIRNNYAGFYVDDVTITGNVSTPLPGQAASPEPANAATNVSLTNNLSWTAGSGATSHNVYFGTTSPPTFRGNQAGTTYDTGRMTPGTTYYWRIDEKNASGTTTGMVWSFTTAVSEVWQSESVNWRVGYGNNWNKTGTVTKPGATAIRLHLGTIGVESGWDHLYSNAGDNWSGTYTDVTSGENSGDSITLTLTSDISITGYFIIDRVDYQGTSAGPATKSGELFDELPPSTILITRCTVTAGNKESSDKISLSGIMDATADDFISADDIYINIDSNNILYSLDFPIDDKTFKMNRYRYSRTEDGVRKSFTYDVKTGKFTFAAANVDLSGLACPLTVLIEINSYVGAAEVDEAIVNGPRMPMPIKLMMGVKDVLRVDKCTVKQNNKKPNSDLLSVKGAFAVEDTDANMVSEDLVVTLGTQQFTIPANKLKARNGYFTCSIAEVTEGGIAAANFNFGRCSFILTIKNTTVTAGSGVVDFFCVAFAGYSQCVQITFP